LLELLDEVLFHLGSVSGGRDPEIQGPLLLSEGGYLDVLGLLQEGLERFLLVLLISDAAVERLDALNELGLLFLELVNLCFQSVFAFHTITGVKMSLLTFQYVIRIVLKIWLCPFYSPRDIMKPYVNVILAIAIGTLVCACGVFSFGPHVATC